MEFSKGGQGLGVLASDSFFKILQGMECRVTLRIRFKEPYNPKSETPNPKGTPKGTLHFKLFNFTF